MNANKVIEVGNPIDCPRTCAFCDFAYRVKSGMFSESVAQKPTIPVNAGKKNFQNWEVESLDGVSKIGPNPFAAEIAQNNKASAATGRKMALNTKSFRMLSTPR